MQGQDESARLGAVLIGAQDLVDVVPAIGATSCTAATAARASRGDNVMPNYLLTAGGNIGSFPWSFTMKATAPGTEATVETAWASGIAAMYGSAGFAGDLSTATELTFTSTSTADAAWKQTTKTETTHAISGTGTGALPYQIAAIVTWRTNQATKYGHGRWYVAGFAPVALAAGGFMWSATATANLVTAVNAALTAWGTTFTPVVLHRKGTISGPGPLTTDPIIKGDVSDKAAVQRRRGDKATVTRSDLTF